MPYLTLTLTENLKLQLSPGLVASCDIQPGNGVGLFWDKHTHVYSLPYLPRTHTGRQSASHKSIFGIFWAKETCLVATILIFMHNKMFFRTSKTVLLLNILSTFAVPQNLVTLQYLPSMPIVQSVNGILDTVPLNVPAKSTRKILCYS